MTGREAMDTIKREAAAAGVPSSTMAGREVERVLVEALDANPRTIPYFLASARERIAEEAGQL